MNQKVQWRGLAVLLVLVFSATVQAESPVVDWVRQVDSTGVENDWDFGWDVTVDSGGNSYVTGFTLGSFDGNPNQGGMDTFLMKYDTNGNQVWVKQMGLAVGDRGLGVEIDSNDNVYLTGGNESTGMFLMKYNTNGDWQWTQELGTAGDSSGYSVSVDGSNNVYVTGWTTGDLYGSNQGGIDTFLAKYSSNGTQQWVRQLGTAGEDLSYGISVDANGNAYVTGYTDADLGGTNQGGLDIFLTKYDTNGDQQWVRQLGTDAYERGYGVSVDSNGNAYVTGDSYGDLDGNTPLGNQDMFLVKYDTNGDKQWTKLIGTDKRDVGYGVSIDDYDNVYVAGHSYSDPYNNADVLLVKYDENGIEQWTKKFGSESGDFCWDVAVEGDGTAYVTGPTGGSFEEGHPEAGHLDIFLAKVSVVPEPSTLALLAGAAVMGLLYFRRKRG